MWHELFGWGRPDPETFTRPQFVERLRIGGIDVSPRTLAYWEGEGIIPHSTREWRDGAPHAIYPDWMLNVVTTVRTMQREGATLDQIRRAAQKTPWYAATGDDLVARFAEYADAADALAFDVARLVNLRGDVYGAETVEASVQFHDADGSETVRRLWEGE